MSKRKQLFVLLSAFALLVAGITSPVTADSHSEEKAPLEQQEVQKADGMEQQGAHNNNKDEQYTDSKIRDAWLDGKLELAYAVNRHLNPFTIDTKLVDGVAYLTGTVESEIDKELAELIAVGIDGIHEVKNNLVVDKKAVPAKSGEEGEQAMQDSNQERSFAQWFDDATVTAMVKSSLLSNSETEGLKINVDTNYDVVTLSGTVSSNEEKDLAGQVAENTEGVREVNNLLDVASP